MTFDEFKRKYNITGLNPQQEAAVQATDGQTLVLAVPGSGKTTVLIIRIGYMVHALGISPDSILTITYTKASAADMRRKYAEIFPGDEATLSRLKFRTINGHCYGIIRKYESRNRLEESKMIDEKEKTAILRKGFLSYNKEQPTEAELRELQTYVSYAKNKLLPLSEVEKLKLSFEHFPEILKGYQEQLRSSSAIDFDDQLIYALQILRKDPNLLREEKLRWKYINVDESQDTSLVQHKLVQLLIKPAENMPEPNVLFMVGDEDQSIYRFRAAEPQCLYEFERTYPAPRVMLMETNYRSTKQIVELADAFIQGNKGRHQKHIIAAREENGPEVDFIRFPSKLYQYDYLVEQAKRSSEDTAILFRDNDSAIPLIDRLQRNNVPFRVREKDSLFFSKPTVLDMTGIIRFAQGNCTDRTFFAKNFYKLGLYIKRAEVELLLSKCPPGANIIKTLADYKGPDIPERVTENAELTYKAMATIAVPGTEPTYALNLIYIAGYKTHMSKKPSAFNDYALLSTLAAKEKTVDGFLKRLDQLQQIIKTGSDAETGPTLSTLHSAKGLEFDTVFMMDCVEGTLPSTNELKDPDQYAEDRRLFYVGMTRAKNRLFIIRYDSLENPFTDEVIRIRTQLRAVKHKAQAQSTEKPERTPKPDELQTGIRVEHYRFGPGTVIWNDGQIVKIDFDKYNKAKTLDVKEICRKCYVRRL